MVLIEYACAVVEWLARLTAKWEVSGLSPVTYLC